MMIRTLALLLAFALPAGAQDISTPSGLMTHFVTRCNQIAQDPLAAKNTAPGAGHHAAQDGSLITHYEAVFPGTELFFRQMTHAGGTQINCAMLLQNVSGQQYNGLGALIASNAATLFGTDMVVSGDHGPHTAVLMLASPDFPPRASLTLIQQIDYIELLLSLTSPK